MKWVAVGWTKPEFSTLTNTKDELEGLKYIGEVPPCTRDPCVKTHRPSWLVV